MNYDFFAARLYTLAPNPNMYLSNNYSMSKYVRTLMVLMLLLSAVFSTTAQEAKPALHFFTKRGKGFGVVTHDSLFSLNFQFRMQNRAGFMSKDVDDLEAESFEF